MQDSIVEVLHFISNHVLPGMIPFLKWPAATLINEIIFVLPSWVLAQISNLHVRSIATHPSGIKKLRIAHSDIQNQFIC